MAGSANVVVAYRGMAQGSSVASVEVVDPGRSAGQLPTRSLTE